MNKYTFEYDGRCAVIESTDGKIGVMVVVGEVAADALAKIVKQANKACTRRAKVGAQKVSSKSKKVAKPARG